MTWVNPWNFEQIWAVFFRQSQSMFPSLHFLLFRLSWGVTQSSELGHCFFYSRYYSSWFDDLKKFPNIHCIICTLMTPSCTLFHFNEFFSISWNTYHHFHWHSHQDKLELSLKFTMTSSLRWIVICILLNLFAAFDTVEVGPQSIENWISCYWTQNNNVSNLLILQTNFSAMISSQSVSLLTFCFLDIVYFVLMGRKTIFTHSLILCSQSCSHLWLWHVFFWLNQLCIWILSFSHSWHS